MTFIGIDVGGTTIKGIRWDGGVPDGELARRPSPRESPQAVVDAIAEVVAELRTPQVRAVGLAVPGIIDDVAGIAVTSAYFGWAGLPVRDLVSEATGLPTALGHDVRSAGLAEATLGASHGTQDSLLIALGTGIGAAVVSGGRLLTGAGYAGQFGHVVLDPDGPPCGCGQRGCASTLASASSVVRRYVELSGDQDVTGADQVAARARSGDPAAVAVWDETVASLTDLLLIGVTLFGPEVIVLGGGLAMAGDQLIDPVAERLTARLTFHRRPELVRATLGEAAGRLGAALLARDLVARG